MAYVMHVPASCFPEVNRRCARVRTAYGNVDPLQALGANPDLLYAAVLELEAAVAAAQEFLSSRD